MPSGDVSLWRHGPFEAEIRDDTLYGRGAADMKSSIAAFASAASRYLADTKLKGSISLLITGDEEGPAINGTPKMLGWLKEHGETLSHCIVGEPTATARAGDTLKFGRRGSLTTRATVRGVQGHVGYPAKARNPIPAMAALVQRLSSHVLDEGTEHFEPSTLAFTTVDVGNPAANVIPAEARATFNIRFNDSQTPEALKIWIEARGKPRRCARHELRYGVEVQSSAANAFLTEPGAFVSLVADAARDVLGMPPDAVDDRRHIGCAIHQVRIAPIAELGLPGGTMHKTDECMPVAEIHRLSDIYKSILDRYFAQS